MNTLKITYAYEGAEKTVLFNDVHRFYEAYTYQAKDLITVVTNKDGGVSDAELAEMLNAEIRAIGLNTVSSDDATKTLNVILNDYPIVRDIRKEYDFEAAEIRIQIIFQKSFRKVEEESGDPLMF
jgi:hypothetical protein